MRASRDLCALVVLLAVAVPAAAHARTEQVVATRDIGADVAVDAEGRAFLVGAASRRPFAVGVRSAVAGARFGPWRSLDLRPTDRAVDVAVAADGSGVIVVGDRRRRDRRVRVATFSATGDVGTPQVVSRGARADFAGLAMARSGAAVVVWFRHGHEGRWRLEASARDPGAVRFGRPRPVSTFVRRPCCTSVSVAIGERGDAVARWRSTIRPAVWAARRRPGDAFRAPRRLARESSDVPRAVVGAGGAAAVIYSLQNVPRRAGDGLQLHRATGSHGFTAAEHVNPGGGVTIGATAVTASGRVFVAWVDPASGERGARIRVSEAGPGEPLVITGELGEQAAREPLAVAADDDGRAVVAWSELVSTVPAYLERPTAAIRPALDAPFGPPTPLGAPWRAAEPRLALAVAGGGALVMWAGARYGNAATRRAVLAVTRLP